MDDDKKITEIISSYMSKLRSEGKSDKEIGESLTKLYNEKYKKTEKNKNSSKNIDITSFSNILTSGIEETKSDKGGIKTILDILQKGLNGDIKGILFKSAEDTFGGYLKNTNKLLENTNQVMGMSGKLSKDFQENILNVWPHAERLGISFEELNESITSLVSNSGKFKVLDENSMKNMVNASKFVTNGIQGFSELASKAENVSLGINDTAREVTKMMKSSIEMGLNYKKVIEGVGNSLESLNKYGFKNGIQGLSTMVQKAIEFRMKIEDTFNFADKVFSPEDALQTVSRLQMIGGAIGDLNDPLKLMYMSTNNVEGLQESLINATKSLVTYNQEQGRFEITGANLRRAKEMADTMGVSMEQLGKTSIAAAERASAATDLMSKNFNISEEDKTFITNLSRMEGGKMVITIPEELKDNFKTVKNGQVSLEDLTASQLKELKEYRKELVNKTPEQIAKEQVGFLSNIDRNLKFLTAKAQLEMGKGSEKIIELLGFDPIELLKKSENLANNGYDYIDKGSKILKKYIDSTSSNNKTNVTEEKLKATQNNNSTNNEKQNSVEVTKETTENRNINVSYNFKSFAAITDPLTKYIMNQPQFLLDEKGSYLNQA